jgi:predicted DsbA family dithiol-disulfide isomerase
MTAPVLEVFADVLCPFAHVGLRRVVGRRAELGLSGPALWVRAWPLELVNDEAPDPSAIARHVEELRAQVAPELFRGFDPAAVPHSAMPSLALVAQAYRVSVETGERVSLEIRDAFWEHGRDIGSPAVLGEIASRNGVLPVGPDGEREVLAELEEGRRRGVRGSPEFFLGDRGYFCPALVIERNDAGLVITPNSEAFDRFLADCFQLNAR